MNFKFVPMTEPYAQQIASWRYEGIYAFYDSDADPTFKADLFDESGWGDKLYAVLSDDDSLSGFFGYTVDGNVVEIGLGMRPDLTGKGLGASFVDQGLEFAREIHSPEEFRLFVATFNKRAILVYERAGFERVRETSWLTAGAMHDFIEMRKPA